MRLALADEVLLLAVDDAARYRTRGPVGIVLSGALLAEAVLAGAPDPLGLAPGKLRRRRLASLVGQHADDALGHVAGRLCAAGVLAPVTHKVLGFFPRHGHRVLDPVLPWEAAQRLRAALVPGARPDPATATLAGLCAASGIARLVVPPPAYGEEQRAVAEHVNGLPLLAGAALAEVLSATRDAYRRTGNGAGGGGGFLSSSSDGGCYGDAGGAGSGGDGGGSGDGGGGGDGGGC